MAPYVSLTAQRQLVVVLPPIADQRRIADVLGSFDDKIALNRRIMASLVGLCRSTFESRLDGVTVSKGAEPLTLGDVVEVLETGGRPQGGVSGYREGVPSIGAESITGLGEFDFSKTKYVPADYYAAMRRGRLENRDVLLYKDGGRPGLFEPHLTMVGDGFPFETAAINEHVYRLRARRPYTQTLLYLWLSGAEAMNEMRVKGTGVAIPGLNSTALRSIHVPAFRSDAARELDRILEPLVARVLLAARESRVLAQTRDLLLPRLLGAPERQ
jgi:type I restriction enzyme S subunit